MTTITALQIALRDAEKALEINELMMKARGINDYTDESKLPFTDKQLVWKTAEARKAIYWLRRRIADKHDLGSVGELWVEAEAE